MQVAWKKEGTDGGSLEPFFYIAHLPATLGIIRHVVIGDSLLACHDVRVGCSFSRLIQRLVWDVPSQYTMCSCWIVVQADHHKIGTTLATRIST